MSESLKSPVSGQMEELIKKVWPRWEIESLLGEGAYGCVFKAKREDLGGTYYSAIKVVGVPKTEAQFSEAYQDGMDEASATSFFKNIVEIMVREFALLDQLKGNSNIVSYEDHEVIQRESGKGWDILIRMELLTPLGSYMQSHPFSQKEVVKLGIDISKALVLCEKHNIVHRDIKPENVFVSSLGDYKLGDFGVARTAEQATSGMSVRGTYSYMAPEVYKGQDYNLTVDIYSLGVMLFRLCNYNRAPFVPLPPNPITLSDKERSENLRFNGTEFPDAAFAGPELMAIIRKAVAYNPKDRYLHAADLLKDLEIVYRLLNDEKASAEELSVSINASAQDKVSESVDISNEKDAKNDVKSEEPIQQPKEKKEKNPKSEIKHFDAEKLVSEGEFSTAEIVTSVKKEKVKEKLPEGVLGSIIFYFLIMGFPFILPFSQISGELFTSSDAGGLIPLLLIYYIVFYFTSMFEIENSFLDNKLILPSGKYYGAALKTGLIGVVIPIVVFAVMTFIVSNGYKLFFGIMPICFLCMFFIVFFALLLWNEGKKKAALIPLIVMYVIMYVLSLGMSYMSYITASAGTCILISLIFAIVYLIVALIAVPDIRKNKLLAFSKLGTRPVKLQSKITLNIAAIVFGGLYLLLPLIFSVTGMGADFYDAQYVIEMFSYTSVLLFLVWKIIKRYVQIKTISKGKAFKTFLLVSILAFVFSFFKMNYMRTVGDLYITVIDILEAVTLIEIIYILAAAVYCYTEFKYGSIIAAIGTVCYILYRSTSVHGGLYMIIDSAMIIIYCAACALLVEILIGSAVKKKTKKTDSAAE